MNLIQLLEDTLRDIEDNQIKTSVIVSRCYRIATHLKDVDEIIWLYYNMSEYEELSQNKELKKQNYLEIVKKYGTDQSKNQWNNFLEEYIRIRSAHQIDPNNPSAPPKNYVIGLSVSSIENRINSLKMNLERNTLPDGMHPVDLYFKLESKQHIDIFLQGNINSLNDVLDRIKNRSYNKLVKYEQSLSQEQKKEGINISNNKNIFIIHGSNEAKWRELKSIISDELHLNPIILQEQPDKGMTIIEKFEYYAEQCCYAFAIFTPDDIIEKNNEKYFQARPNVIFELSRYYSKEILSKY